MNLQELLENDISELLKKKSFDRENVKIRKRPNNLLVEIFCRQCGAPIAKATWDEPKWVWEEYECECF